MSLSVIVPYKITDARLASSTLAEADYPLYDNTVSYAVGARVISTATHRVYESLRASNGGHPPTVDANRSGAAPWWLDVGPTNRWAMFDDEISTQSIGPSPMTIVLRPGAINALFLAGIDAEAISVTVKDAIGGAVIYSYSGRLEGSAPSDYLAYYYDQFKPATDFLATGLTPYGACEVTITLTRASGNIAVGVLVAGFERPLGKTLAGAQAELVSYSYIKTDEFGKTTIRRRKSAKDMSASAVVMRAEADSVLSTLSEVLDVPAVFIASRNPQQAALRCYGLGKGRIVYDQYVCHTLELTVEGFI